MYYQKTCEYCGKQFTAQKSSTRFCSKICADRANKERMRKLTQAVVETKDKIDSIQNNQSFGDILSPRTLALYLGVSLRTAYRYLENGMIPAITTNKKTFIRRSDVDKLFDSAPPYQKRSIDGKEKDETKGGKNVKGESYTTVKEVAERYELSLGGADKILKESGITVIKHKGKHYYYMNEVEALFRKRLTENHPEITEWYTCAEIQEKFGLKPASIYDIVSSFKIPTKKVRNVTYYSKVHFDMTRGVQPADAELWYTVQEAMDKYGQTRDQVYNVLRYNNVQRVQVGRNVKFRRSDYDEVMKFTVRNND